MERPIRILGIDPGSRATGWAVIECIGSRLSFVGAGTIRPSRNGGRAERLAEILTSLNTVMDAKSPHEAAVEQTFVNASPRDALVLGEARGIALCAPALRGLPIAEYAANTVKKTVVGKGHADKRQVQAMVRVLLPQSGDQAADAADALAVAICHAHHRAMSVEAIATSSSPDKPEDKSVRASKPSPIIRRSA
ncbi:MAG: crossover junction endodeoxyribonuclease RuvC [Pseudomonadota bacterium]